MMMPLRKALGVLPVCSLLLAPSCVRSATAALSYYQNIAPIFKAHCNTCHQPAGIAADSALTTYESTQRWLASIKTQVSTRQMPPWPADATHSARFSNDARLSEKDIADIVSWIDQGAPAGPKPEQVAEPVSNADWAYPGGREPDAIVSLPQFTLNAQGEIPYIVRRVKVTLPQDRWIEAMQARPSNNLLVHHMGIAEVRLGADLSDSDINALEALSRQTGMADGALLKLKPALPDPTNPDSYDMLGVYTPGTTLERYHRDSGKLLKAGRNHYINFNIHYTTTGQVEKDRSQLAFWFRAEPPLHQLYRVPAPGQAIIANNRPLLLDDAGTKAEGTAFAIPPIAPYVADYELIGITAYSQPVTLFSLQPHGHIRAKDFTYQVVYPDGREETLLTVPRYDFHWQLEYQLETPRRLPAGSTLVVTAHYDNSDANLHLKEMAQGEQKTRCGPDKEAYFRQQNQSWDEMFSPLIQYSIDNEDAKRLNLSRPADKALPVTQPLPLIETVGCLSESSQGHWSLIKANAGQPTPTQATSQVELKQAAALENGQNRFNLLGTRWFHPEDHLGHRVAVKGMRINASSSATLNVTSLQPLEATCP